MVAAALLVVVILMWAAYRAVRLCVWLNLWLAYQVWHLARWIYRSERARVARRRTQPAAVKHDNVLEPVAHLKPEPPSAQLADGSPLVIVVPPAPHPN